jgi:hypothetical protein
MIEAKSDEPRHAWSIYDRCTGEGGIRLSNYRGLPAERRFRRRGSARDRSRTICRAGVMPAALSSIFYFLSAPRRPLTG